MTTESEIDKLAQDVAKEALNAPDLRDKVEALKVLTGYFTAVAKHRKGQDPKEDGPSFEAFEEDLSNLRAS